MLQIRDRWFRILIILLPLVLVAYINGVLTNPSSTKVITTLISFAAIIIICEGSRQIAYKSHQWFPDRYRISFVFAVGISWTAFWLAFSIIVRQKIATGNWDLGVMHATSIVVNDKTLVIGLAGYSFLNAAVNFSALLLGFEILYKQAQYRYTKEEKEKLEKEKLKAELLQLKGIVNPHFLFNNLNSLSSLISENPVQAQEFLDELTRVFRYLLRNNQTELTTLSEELKFIQTYYQLLRTRYGKGIDLDMQIDQSYHQLLIPPLTLQLLVENAVKHNQVQKDNPLRIELLSADGQKLVVRNNIYKKEGKVESTGIGLQNINARYKMLNRPCVVIDQNNGIFSVIISLIEG